MRNRNYKDWSDPRTCFSYVCSRQKLIRKAWFIELIAATEAFPQGLNYTRVSSEKSIEAKTGAGVILFGSTRIEI